MIDNFQPSSIAGQSVHRRVQQDILNPPDITGFRNFFSSIDNLLSGVGQLRQIIPGYP